MRIQTEFKKLLKAVSPTRAARQIGVSRIAVTRWKRNPGAMRLEHFAGLVDYMELTPEQIGEAVKEIGGQL